MSARQEIVRALRSFFGPPSAEFSGLLADQVRLYRWKAATRIVDRAKKFAKAQGIFPKQIPFKFLVPFIELASLEDEDGPLTDMWAQLLVRATDQYESKLAAFTRILSEIGGVEAELLQELFKKGDCWEEDDYQVLLSRYNAEDLIRDVLISFPEKFPRFNYEKDRKHIVSLLDKAVGEYPCEIIAISLPVEFHKNEEKIGGNIDETRGLFNEYATQCQLAERQGLLRMIETRQRISVEAEVGCTWISITPLGADLVRTCSKPKKPRAKKRMKN